MQSPTIELEGTFKLLTLTAKAVHRSGEHSEIQGTFGNGGGSIGRQPECDMVLPDPDRRISRLQARILFADDQYAVCNASTSNPMYVNGVELAPGSSQAIGDGDELRAGSYVMAVSLPANENANAPQPASLLTGGGKSVPMPVNAVSQVAPEPQENAHSDLDRLLALGSNLQGSANPFADLLGQAAPINGAPAVGEDEKKSAPPPSFAANGLPDERVSEQLPLTGQDRTDSMQTPQELPLVERRSGGAASVVGDSPSRRKAQAQWPAADDFDRSDPFGDLLTQKVPAGVAETGLGVATSGAEPLLSKHDMVASSAIWQPDQAVEHLQTTSDAPQTGASDTLQNLLEPPSAPAVRRKPRSLQDLGEAALPSLAGDPFGDLMGAPVEEHMAHAPVFDPAPPRVEVIPDDFNPLAVGGVAQRNSADPLTPMGRNAKGLADVVPQKTIDSVYSPGSESPTTLVVDPLDQVQQRFLKVEQSTDPLKLFANGGKGLIPDDSGARTSGSTRDDAREMVAYFRVPVPKIEIPAEAAGNASSAVPESDLPGEPDSTGGLPADFLASVTPSNMALPTMADQEGDPSSPLPPVMDAVGANSVSEPEPTKQDSARAEASQPASSEPEPSAVPQPLAAPELVAAMPSIDREPERAEQSDAPQAQELMAAFKRGAGLDEWSATSLTPEMMETLGRLFQTAVQGAVSLLAARAAIKQEIHLSVTLINPKANNPLKFLPDGHAAMLQLLGPKMPGFMAPADAMQEAFNDLLIHQAAIAAGTQATVEALFRRFDPQTIESRYPRIGIGEKLSQAVHAARLWNIYIGEYQSIREETRDDFFKRLGSEFHDAYNKEYGNHAADE